MVAAYWIGNELLEKVAASPFFESLGDRFRPRMTGGDFGWLATKFEQGARPHHNFHVFEIHTRAGLMRNEKAHIALETMDSCRISWGKVAAIEGDELLVERPALVLAAGKLALSEPRATRVTRQIGPHGFVDGVQPGGHVSIHWDWACQVLSAPALARVQAATSRYLDLANQTI